MLNLYVIRHGETEWNKQKRMQCRLDSDLTEKGKKDARLLGERLKETEFVRIISSPSKRTYETAKLVVGETNEAIETDERLMEIHLGDWQGKVEEDIKREYPDQFHAYWNLPASFESVDGESFHDVKERILEFLMELERYTPSGNVLVVTHGVVIKALYLLCRNAPIEEIWNPPFIYGTSLTMIKMQNGKMDLVLEGCTEHCS
ncbi:histidine phosphatase family protein [Bacillus sp. DTU_2020_1000418_1_SI_GHA_SEK_038]|uniref:histidine phosphatase family protein n=1 Tax=Bacillus sp. DTU_2020_1000418_1_SI_GHA_SEK_038 TaxID=3077585 RepID=UPI0028EC9159|nr:histidine phosphatase family protein [Bacillus sp. DTU_2020_1000418_1_SI_GHA_SEK_038]WNS75920.1 histidine phosphatase family protein [Bacillus sp. DTU_2020_1000418_1_SI_GHA_SEK_038]